MKWSASQGCSKITDSREIVENTCSKLVQSLCTDYSQGTSDPSSLPWSNAVGTESPEPDGLQALSRIQKRLGSMRSGKLKASLDLVDKVAKVCSYWSHAYEEGMIEKWNSDSSMCRELVADCLFSTSSEFPPGIYDRGMNNSILTNAIGISEESENGFGCHRPFH